MKRKQMTSLNNQKQTATVLALSFALLNGTLALAQGMEAGQMGTLSPSSALGPEQESMLPPEVVPLDPATAQRLSQSQAEARAMQASMPAPGSTPGLVGAEYNGMQSVQDARKTAFEALLGRGQTQGMNQYLNKPPLNAVPAGQTGWTSNTAGAQGQPVQLVAHQTQTLTGGSTTPAAIQETKKGGFSNSFSSSMGWGSRLLLGRGLGGPNSLGSLGFFGLGATGFGTRNGFRL